MSNAITWLELAGDASIDPEAAARFIEWKFRKDDVVAVRTHGTKWATWAMPRDEAVETLREGLEESAEREDVYFALNPLKEPYTNDDGKYVLVTSHGVRKEHVKTWRTLFADIDVKPGAFVSQDAVRSWVETLEVPPGAVVWTQADKGGCHLHWKVKGLTDLDFSYAQERWWSYLMSTAPEGVSIDRLVDVTRVARIPGSTRLPKGAEKSAPVIAEYLDSAAVDRETFDRLTEEPYKETEKRKRRTRGNTESLFTGIEDIAGDSVAGIAFRMALIDRTPDYFTWEEILEAKGWTYLKTESGGAKQWARPGQNRKSATTGHLRDDGNMSLFSWDQETGLADLYEVDETLTMFRVLMRLWFNDDIEATLVEIKRRFTENA